MLNTCSPAMPTTRELEACFELFYIAFTHLRIRKATAGDNPSPDGRNTMENLNNKSRANGGP